MRETTHLLLTIESNCNLLQLSITDPPRLDTIHMEPLTDILTDTDTDIGGGEIQMEPVGDDALPPSSPLPMTRYQTLSREHVEEEAATEEKKYDIKSTTSIVKNQSHSLKRSILHKFMPLTFSLLLVVSLCTIAALFLSSRFILNQTHEMLEDQFSRYGGYIAKGN